MIDYRIYSGIVTYNPDIDRLKENIEAVLPQVGKVVIFDNGSDNIKKMLELTYENVELIESKKNKGIAYALNKLMEYGIEHGFDWMLSLDQDSVTNSGMVDILAKELENKKKVGIIAPIIVDRAIGVIGHSPKECKEVRTCITSGALTSLVAWKAINGFDEKMFIDSVDFDFCYRLRKNGYKVMQTPAAKLIHSVGTGEQHCFLLWKFNYIKHNAFREFYISQNNIYYPRKHHLWLHLIRGNYRNLRKVIQVIIFEKADRTKLNAIIRGWKQGYNI